MVKRRAPAAYGVLVSRLQRWVFGSLRAPRRPRGTPPRLAYVIRRYPAQADTYIRRELAALSAFGVPVDVFSRERPEPMPAAEPSLPIGPVHYLPPLESGTAVQYLRDSALRQPWDTLRIVLWVIRHPWRPGKVWADDRRLLFEAVQLAMELTRHQVTHVHAPWADETAFRAFIAARLAGATFSAEGRASEIRRRAQAPLVANRLRFAEFVLTNSEYNAEYLRSLLGGDAGPPVHRVYEGLDPAAIPVRPAARAPGPWRLLSVARLVEPKGLRHLLLACDRLRHEGVFFTCDIIGGPEPDDMATWVHLRRLHAELGLGGVVNFLGMQPYAVVTDMLARADLFVLPCVHARDGSHDITPNSLLEAMAHGLPAVSTNVGAIPEIVEHGTNGMLVPPGDADALAQALASLIGSDETRSHLGAAARLTIKTRFDIARNIASHAALFRAVAGNA